MIISEKVRNYVKKNYMNNLIEDRTLRSAVIELLTNCNFKCVHCYNQDVDRKILDFDCFKTIIEQLKAMGCKKITLTGGEPLLHPNFREIFECCIDMGFQVDLFTNGYYIDKYINLLKSKSPRRIEISLYGTNDETYKKICKVNDGYTKVFSNLQLLKKEEINFSLKTIIMKSNFNEYEQMKIICEKLNVPFKFDVIILNSKNFTNSQDMNILGQEFNKFMEIVKRDKINNWNTYIQRYKERECCNLLYKCFAGRKSVFISSFGGIRICNFAKFSEKNINDMLLKEIWQSFDEFLSIKDDKNTECNKCKYRVCCSNCPVATYMAFQTDGKVILPIEQNCREAKYIYDSIKKNN